jgi:hypothetical protein
MSAPFESKLDELFLKNIYLFGGFQAQPLLRMFQTTTADHNRSRNEQDPITFDSH